jgi:hypothetical protein
MDFSKKIFVFSSHHHMDHFNIEIFQLLKNFNSVSYIFYKDIYKKYNQKFFTSHGVFSRNIRKNLPSFLKILQHKKKDSLSKPFTPQMRVWLLLFKLKGTLSIIVETLITGYGTTNQKMQIIK